MIRKSLHPFYRWLPATILVTALLACNMSQAVAPSNTAVSGENNLPTIANPTAANPTVANPTTAAPEPTATETPTLVPIVHVVTPGTPPGASESNITDRDSSAFVTQRRTNGGDNFDINIFERPFNANTMDKYFPDLDIIKASLKRDGVWVFVTITLTGQNQSGGLLENYGVEVDTNMDGRGDFLIMASKPGQAWSTDRVRVWADKNHDVGSSHPIQSDPPSSTDGYETLVFDSGTGADPDTAWARVSPTNQNSVQIAFKRSIINDPDKFIWGAWAISDSMFNPAWFDYNDHFTIDQAGSPLVELTKYYPLKSLAEVDNTCRWGVGFTPTGSEPGVCPVPPTPTPIIPGTISGIVFRQINGNLIYPPGILISGATIRVRSGGCGSPGAVVTTGTTNGSGYYIVTVNPGTYCVDVSPNPVPTASTRTGPQTVTVGSGAAVNNVNFGFSEYLGMH
jgi:hypothetical protein